MLKLNTIQAQPGSRQSRKRLGRGRGSGLGQTGGKGGKGQTARSGASIRPGFEGGQTPLYRRLPKVGFKNFSRLDAAEVNLSDLSRWSIQDVSIESLRNAKHLKGKFRKLVILGNGEITSAVRIKAHKVSAAARAKIEKAGGSVEILSLSSAPTQEA